jgi:predicted ATPase/class 3 adenylate cyclase
VTDAAVTYLFSDVEGSTRLWETEPERIGPALARHDALARRCVEQHGGRVVKTTGDGLHAAFEDPAAAVAAAVELQIEVCHPPAGVLPLALRCGLHLGVDQRRDGDYFGPAVNRAARVMSAAHGGQVLLSQAVVERVADRLPPEQSLRDLGIVRLRDLTQPDRLFQLVHPRLRSEFPALRSLASTPNNLPQQLNSFVGRERELDEVRAMLGYPTVRLLTLLGMGGLGKSRLSLQAAAEVLDDYPDGVWFVELAPLSDPRSVPQAVASVLGVKEEAGGAVLDALLRFLRDKTLLLVLDNCEHVVQACAELARQVLQSAPRVKLLASSRDALQTAGETVIHVPPLAAPDAGATISPATLAQIDAVRLFIDRASAAQPSFRVTDKNAAAVAAICRRLDGIPLALELAAARTRALSVEAIAARLDDRFKLLVSGDRTVLPRQRTLRALIDWSYDLLSAPERRLFARLSVFAGGWSLEAAEAVGADGEDDASAVLDLLVQLVEKSLVLADIEGGRYRMLDTVRQYAHERLAECGDAPAASERHLAVYLALAEQARARLAGPEQPDWLARLDAERDNLLAAHGWALRSPQGGVAGLRLVFALRPYLIQRGLLILGHRLAVEALAHPQAAARDLARCQALHVAGQLCCFLGRYAEAVEHLRESLAIAEEIGDTGRVMSVQQPLGMALHGLGDLDGARHYFEQAVRLAEQGGQPRPLAAAVNALAQFHRAAGDDAQARPLYDRVLVLARQLGDPLAIAIAQLNLAMVAIGAGESPAARAGLLDVLNVMAAGGADPVAQSVIEVCAGLAASAGDAPTAARLFGFAEAHNERTGLQRDAADAHFLLPLIERARAAAPAAFDEQACLGGELSLEAALGEARAWLQRPA